MTMLALAATVTTTQFGRGVLTGRRATATTPLAARYVNYGFVPIAPSNLMKRRSLYYVDSGVKDSRRSVTPRKDDSRTPWSRLAAGDAGKSRRNGRFATGVKLTSVGCRRRHRQEICRKGALVADDILLEEIPLGSNWLIFAKLMEKPHAARSPCDTSMPALRGARAENSARDCRVQAGQRAQSRWQPVRRLRRHLKDIVKLSSSRRGDRPW